MRYVCRAIAPPHYSRLTISPTMPQPVFRFAPSPNGELHLGHALSALIGYERARTCGGRFLLRIEDIDMGRSRPQFVAGIFANLAWLGIVWEEPVVFQSQRLSAYRAAAGQLSPGGGRRRRLAGRDPRHPRARPLSRYRPAPPIAGAAGSAGSRLSPPPADHGRPGAQARQERARHELEIAAGKRLQPGRH